MCNSKEGRYCPGREPARVLAGRLTGSRESYSAAVSGAETDPSPAARDDVARERARFDAAYTRYAGTRAGQRWLRENAEQFERSGDRARAAILSRFADHARDVRATGRGGDEPVPGDALLPTHCPGCGRFTGGSHTCPTPGAGRDVDVYDVDGTLLDTTKIVHLVERDAAKDMARFHAESTSAPANAWVVDAARVSRIEGRGVVVLTARSTKLRNETAMWLAQQQIPMDSLVMRAPGDHRPAAVVKEDALEHLSKTRTVRKAFDDTTEVLDMWERRGIRSVRVPRPSTGGYGPAPTGPYRGWQVHPDDLVTGLRAKTNGLRRRAHPVVTTEPHVTLEFGQDAASRGAPGPARMEAVGYARNGRVEALVVAVNGTTDRPDGSTFHITLSREQKVPPRESNDLLKEGWVALPEPFLLKSRPFTGQ